MHVTILQLTGDKSPGKYHYTEDDVFGSNQEEFPDGVTEHTGEEMQDDIKTLTDWLGGAVSATGEETDGSRKVTWVEIDTQRVDALFEPFFKDVMDAVRTLTKMTLADFVDGSSEMASAIHRLKSSYKFDEIYIMDDRGDCMAISEWLRAIREEEGRVQRFYIHAAYDGDQ